jgi:hypothetical protein
MRYLLKGQTGPNGWPRSNQYKFGCPIFGAFFAPKVGIRARREPLSCT